MRVDLTKAYANAKVSYERLGITAEMEAAVIEHLEEIGALASCFSDSGGCDSSKCTNPDNPNCTKTHNNNCVCTRK